MLRRRRPLVRAAALGGTAYVASKHGERKAQQQQEHDDAVYQEGEQAQPQVPAQQQAAGTAEPDRIAALSQLKELLDSGVLTQAEFDKEKQKVLQGP